MNKDLEIIKEQINLKGQHCQSPRYDPVSIILAAAERMAAEIEKAYIAVRLNVEDKERGAIKIERLEHEIACLKDELAKGQELLRCGGCKYYVPNENFCNAGLLGKVSPFDFCFRGQRRESEEGK